MSKLRAFYSHFTNSYVQTFDDLKKARKGLTYKVPISSLWDRIQWFRDKQAIGMGVFFTPNPCSGGRKESDVTSIEWVYVDMDEGTKEEMRECIRSAPIPPHIITESSRSYHLYWKVPCDRPQFDLIIKGLLVFFQGDSAIASTNEVLRAPGFYHMKDLEKPFMVQVIRNEVSPLTPEQMIEAYPRLELVFKKKHALDDIDLQLLRDIPVLGVLQRLGIEVKDNFIVENGQVTSASVNVKENYINRFSGKPGSGSSIDAVMVYGKKTTAEAIQYLKEMIGLSSGNVAKAKAEILLNQEVDDCDDLPEQKYVYTWGTQVLNKNIAPLSTSDYTLISGETGSGKTTFAFQIAKANADKGNKVLFLTLEMSEKDIRTRNAREYAGITKEEWGDKSTIGEDKRIKFKEKMKELRTSKNLILMGAPGASVEVVIETIKLKKPALVIIDNFDLIAKKQSEEYNEQNRISEQLMLFARDEYDGAIIVIHHVNSKANKGEKNLMSIGAIRGSQKIAHNAGAYIYCYRKERKQGEDGLEALSLKDSASLAVVSVKDRDFGSKSLSTIYFQDGEFSDKFKSPSTTDYVDYTEPASAKSDDEKAWDDEIKKLGIF